MSRNILVFLLLLQCSCSSVLWKVPHDETTEAKIRAKQAQDPRARAALATRATLPSAGVLTKTPVVRIEPPRVILRDTPEVRRYLWEFTSARRKCIEEPLQRRERYKALIDQTLARYNLPLELSNVAFIESGFRPEAKSPQGALGLWQFMKSTADLYGLSTSFWNDERKNVAKSTDAAARYLKKLHEQFGDWLLAIAAYNAGPGRVEKAIVAAGGERDFYVLARKGSFRKESVDFVSKFIAITMITKNPDVYDFQHVLESSRTDPEDLSEVDSD